MVPFFQCGTVSLAIAFAELCAGDVDDIFPPCPRAGSGFEGGEGRGVGAEQQALVGSRAGDPAAVTTDSHTVMQHSFDEEKEKEIRS